MAAATLAQGARVVGLDNYHDYHSPRWKRDRDGELGRFPQFTSRTADLTALATRQELFRDHRPQKTCHMATQAGVHYPLVTPFTYQKSHLEGFLKRLGHPAFLPMVS
jgi:UDP-glucuronate 4-epimerase